MALGIEETVITETLVILVSHYVSWFPRLDVVQMPPAGREVLVPVQRQ